MFLITAIVVGLYLPTQYKLGYEKTKFAFVVIIMASPVLTATLLKMEGMNFDALLMAVFRAVPPAARGDAGGLPGAGRGREYPGHHQVPFRQYTRENPNTSYVCVNSGGAFAPEQIAGRSLCLSQEIGEVLRALAGEAGRRREASQSLAA